VTEAGAAMD